METTTQRAKHLKRLGRRRRWPPLVRRENQLKESDPVGQPTPRPQRNLRATVTTYHPVTCSVQSHQEVMNPVPMILQVLTLHPTVPHACTACPGIWTWRSNNILLHDVSAEGADQNKYDNSACHRW
jgi:hypothetical protein